MAFDAEAAKADGFTDEEIAAYLRSEQGTPVVVQEEPGRGAEMAATLVPAAVGAIPGSAAFFATGYGLAKYGPQMMQTGKNIVSKMAGLSSGGGAPTVGTAGNPIGGTGTRFPITTGAAGPVTVPVAGPVAPQPVPATSAGRPFSPQAQQYLQQAAAPAPTAAQPNMMQRGMDYASKMREVAAQRVLPVMGQAGQMAGRGLAAVANSPVTRAGGMAANAMYSGDLNANEAAELERRRKMAPTITR
jgi:hypothetical protein